MKNEDTVSTIAGYTEDQKEEVNKLVAESPEYTEEQKEELQKLIDSIQAPTAVRKHRQNRNTLAAFLRSRAISSWNSAKKGTMNAGRNKAKREAKLAKNSKVA